MATDYQHTAAGEPANGLWRTLCGGAFGDHMVYAHHQFIFKVHDGRILISAWFYLDSTFFSTRLRDE